MHNRISLSEYELPMHNRITLSEHSEGTVFVDLDFLGKRYSWHLLPPYSDAVMRAVAMLCLRICQNPERAIKEQQK
jgi:hypothetical protein